MILQNNRTNTNRNNSFLNYKMGIGNQMDIFSVLNVKCLQEIALNDEIDANMGSVKLRVDLMTFLQTCPTVLMIEYYQVGTIKLLLSVGYNMRKRLIYHSAVYILFLIL